MVLDVVLYDSVDSGLQNVQKAGYKGGKGFVNWCPTFNARRNYETGGQVRKILQQPCPLSLSLSLCSSCNLRNRQPTAGENKGLSNRFGISPSDLSQEQYRATSYESCSGYWSMTDHAAQPHRPKPSWKAHNECAHCSLRKGAF